MTLIPHIKYIETLVIAKLTLDQIKEQLEQLDLSVEDQVLAVIVDTIRKTYPNKFLGTQPEPITEDWLIEEVDVIEGFAHVRPEATFDAKFRSLEPAIKLLSDPLMYRIITSLAFCNPTKEDLELVAQAKFNVEYDPEDFELFLKYFFKVGTWTRKQKLAYAKEVKDPNTRPYFKLALKGDKEFLIWKLGVTPAKDFKEMLVEMTNDSFFNFKEQVTSRPESAQRWAALTQKLVDKIDSMDNKKKAETNNLITDIEFKIKTYSSPEDSSTSFRHFTDLSDD